ncbi:hypothetical protein AAF712_015016, partial [Marasmius tenuissimus]
NTKSPETDIEVTFLLAVFEELHKNGDGDEYFFKDSDKTAGGSREKAWWTRVSPLLKSNIEWPTTTIRTDEWARLDLKPGESFIKAKSRLTKCASTLRSKKRKALEDKLAGKVKEKRIKPTKQTRSGKEQQSRTTSTPVNTYGEPDATPIGQPHTHEAHLNQLPAGEPAASQHTKFDMTTGAGLQPEDVITWTSVEGHVVLTPYPVHLNEKGQNIFWKAGRFLKNLATLGIIHGECNELTVLSREQRTETDIITLASPSLRTGRPVVIWGPRGRDSWKNGLTILDRAGIEDRRICDVFDFVVNETKAITGKPSRRTPEDDQYERVMEVNYHEEEWYLPEPKATKKGEDDSDDYREKIPFRTLLDRLQKGHCSNYALDVPTSGHTGIPYGALDDLHHAINNTKFLESEGIMWGDTIWGLVHGSPTITWWHHDADGKMTIVNAESGAKIWTVFLPNSDLTENEVREVQVWLAQSKDKLPKEDFGKVMNILLLPGDTLIMPPGLLHLVYTPVPSVFRGSSFWNVDTLHLTAASLRADSQYGQYLTNVDHDYTIVYRSLVRLALSLAIVNKYVIRRSIVHNLYDMLVNFRDYLYVSQDADDYRHKINNPKKRRKGRGGKVVITDADQIVAEVKDERVASIRDTAWLSTATSILEAIILASGDSVGADNKENMTRSKKRVNLSGNSWSDPGESLNIDRDVLFTYLL